jgi:hypothetical protein
MGECGRPHPVDRGPVDRDPVVAVGGPQLGDETFDAPCCSGGFGRWCTGQQRHDHDVAPGGDGHLRVVVAFPVVRRHRLYTAVVGQDEHSFEERL